MPRRRRRNRRLSDIYAQEQKVDILCAVLIVPMLYAIIVMGFSL